MMNSLNFYNRLLQNKVYLKIEEWIIILLQNLIFKDLRKEDKYLNPLTLIFSQFSKSKF